MKTPLTQSVVVIGIVAIASSLVVLSLLTDVPAKQQTWTYDEEADSVLNEWKDAGGGDMATAGFPPSILKQFGITERTIAPEIFFSEEFRSALFGSREPFSVMSDPLQSSHEYLDNLSGDREFTLSMENEKRKLAVISRWLNSGKLPQELLEAIELQRDHLARMRERSTENFVEWRNPTSRRTIPIDEAFRMLRPADQDLLEPYREHLTDLGSIVDAAEEVSNEERQAALRLIPIVLRSDEESLALPQILTAPTQREMEQGFRLSPNQIAPTVSLGHAIELHRGDIRTSSSRLEIRRTEVIPLSSVEGRAVSGGMSPVPDGYILPESENFLVRKSGGNWRRYYSRSVFGGAVIVDELEVTSVEVLYPNLLIDGRDAAIWHERYERSHWVTTISTFRGTKQYRFVADGKLENEQKTAFIEFCRKIVEASL